MISLPKSWILVFVALVEGVQSFGAFQPFTSGPSFLLRSTATHCNTDLINGVADIADQFDTFLLDMWGVMHDGSQPYEGVLEVVDKLRKANKKLVILSNSSKRQGNAVKMLQKLGFNPQDFDQVITSGEVAFQMLSGLLKVWDVLDNLQQDEANKKVFVFGSGDSDEEYCESCGWTLAPIEEASLLVARGTFTVTDGTTTVHKREDADEYEKALEENLYQAALRRIPMLVTNPDKIRPDAERPPMPGKIADQYEEFLGTHLDTNECKTLVKRVGKPFQDVYSLATKDDEGARCCMVGDALETDICGGASNGICTIWVLLDGIHGPNLSNDESLVAIAYTVVKDFNDRNGTYAGDNTIIPDLMLRHFRW